MSLVVKGMARCNAFKKVHRMEKELDILHLYQMAVLYLISCLQKYEGECFHLNPVVEYILAMPDEGNTFTKNDLLEIIKVMKEAIVYGNWAAFALQRCGGFEFVQIIDNQATVEMVVEELSPLDYDVLKQRASEKREGVIVFLNCSEVLNPKETGNVSRSDKQ